MNDKIELLIEAAKKYEKQLAGFSGTARHNFAQAPAKAAIDAIPALERLLAGQQEQQPVFANETVQHVYLTDKGAVCAGIPAKFPDDVPDDDPRRHNCDTFGCSSLEHVLTRVRFTDERAAPPVQEAGRVPAHGWEARAMECIKLYDAAHERVDMRSETEAGEIAIDILRVMLSGAEPASLGAEAAAPVDTGEEEKR